MNANLPVLTQARHPAKATIATITHITNQRLASSTSVRESM